MMSGPVLLVGKILLAYLIGSVSGSLLVGRLRGVDIRTQGSGNAGGTNAFRTQGFVFALATILIDVGKGALSAWLGLWSIHGESAGPVPAMYCAAAAVFGHVWPLYHGFRGGKGAGTLIGALLVLWPFILIPALIVWIISLTLTGMVGLSTMLGGLALVPAVLWWRPDDPQHTWLIASILIAAFLVFTHRSNITKMRRGTEHRFEKARVWHNAWRRLASASDSNRSE